MSPENISVGTLTNKNLVKITQRSLEWWKADTFNS